MAPRTHYNYSLLQTLCKTENILLSEDYSNVALYNKSVIQSKCVTPNCVNDCVKRFVDLYKTGSYCPKCTTQNGLIKKEQTNLKKFGVKNPFQSPQIKTKIKNTMNVKYAVNFPSQSAEIRQKAVDTWKKNYEVENPSQSTEIQVKKENTMFEHYGVKYTLQSEKLREQIRTTMKERYDVEHPMYSEEIKDKIKQTCLERYDCENPMQNTVIQQQTYATNMKCYGVKHPAQNAEIAEKSSKNAKAFRDYVFPSGRVERVQGYEHHGLNELLHVEKVDENDITVKKNEVPAVWWEDINHTKHRYFVDILVKSQKRCIEVKSLRTLEKGGQDVLLKKQALEEAGYICEIWVFNKKGKKLQVL